MRMSSVVRVKFVNAMVSTAPEMLGQKWKSNEEIRTFALSKASRET
jgi:hypothetical protein